MLEINNTSNNLVNFSKYSNYVPVVSAATTLVEMFLHYVVHPCIGETKLKSNHYFAHLETKFFVDKINPYATATSKPWEKYLIYIIPVIGNLWAAWKDYDEGEQAKDLEKPFKNETLSSNHIAHYRNAQFHGSAEGAYRLGCLTTGEEATMYLRYAAAKGHAEANTKLGEVEQT